MLASSPVLVLKLVGFILSRSWTAWS